MCLAYNHSLSWSTLTTLAELSNSNQTAPWHSPTFGNPPTPLMSSNLSTTPAACVSGCFPQCLSNPSQPRPKNCKICHVKQEAASVRGGCWPCPQGSEGVCAAPSERASALSGPPAAFPPVSLIIWWCGCLHPQQYAITSHLTPCLRWHFSPKNSSCRTTSH